MQITVSLAGRSLLPRGPNQAQLRGSQPHWAGLVRLGIRLTPQAPAMLPHELPSEGGGHDGAAAGGQVGRTREHEVHLE